MNLGVTAPEQLWVCLRHPSYPKIQLHFGLVQPQCEAITYWAWEEEEEEEGRAITVDAKAEGGAQPHSRHEATPTLPPLLQLPLSPSPTSLIKPKLLITTCRIPRLLPGAC